VWERSISEAVSVAIAADLIRPSLSWLLASGGRFHLVTRTVEGARDPEGFARMAERCDADPASSPTAKRLALTNAAMIVAAKGGTIADICVGDLVEFLEAHAREHTGGHAAGGGGLLYRTLRELGVFGPDTPPTLRALRNLGPRSCDALIDRYGLACVPIRNLLVDYLRERQPAVDYVTLERLSYVLGSMFWLDLERHHPGINSLHLPADVATGWKHRLQTVRKATITTLGEKTVVESPRRGYRECLMIVRGFYLDVAHWAIEDPARWAASVAPSPVRDQEVNVKRDVRRRKSRMNARTRERLPVLPVLVRTVNDNRRTARALIDAALGMEAGECFNAAGTTLRRLVFDKDRDARKIWAEDPETGAHRDLGREEEHAFWSWATVEVLRATGIRSEEMLQLSHHNVVQYRLPTTGELVPLLQIVPSKTDAERLILVSPELAEVLSAIIMRVSGGTGVLPLVCGFDKYEREWLPPAPLLFQHRVGDENRAISPSTIRVVLNEALDRSGLVDPVDGQPLRYTPHDFRRMFITDAVLNGLPPQIAQVIAGHKDINVTMGYAAVYPEDAIQAHLAFLARRRALRPGQEYRVPTDEEWQDFLGHFERRKVALGTCARAYGTPCLHEHACLRCPMLWPDSAQRPRVVELIDNLGARIAEAERESWLGEVDGLQVSLASARDKLAQIDGRQGQPRPIVLVVKPPGHAASTRATAPPPPDHLLDQPDDPSPTPLNRRRRPNAPSRHRL
jgi:integrase